MENQLEYILKQIQSGEVDPEAGLMQLEKLNQAGTDSEIDSSLLFMENKWMEESEEELSEVPSDAFSIIFIKNEEQWRTIEESLHLKWNVKPVILVKGECFEKVNDQTYQIGVQKEEDYQRIISELKLQEKPSIRILHFWSEQEWDSEKNRIESQLQDSLYSLFYLVKGLKNIKKDVYLTYAYTQSKEKPQMLYAAMSGFLRTVMLEKSNIVAKKVSVEAENGTADEVLKLLWKESGIWGEGTEIFLQEGKRLVKEMSECILPKKQTVPLKKHGVYLITGGLGGVGYIFAAYLAKHWNANLILVGRSEPNHDKIALLSGFQNEVEYIQADISDQEQVTSVAQKAREKFGKIDGVIHAAGVVRDAYLFRKRIEDMKEVLAPKVYGTVWLSKALEEEKLDFFVLFSAGAGLTGNIGQCDYAYANCFMDEFSAGQNEENKHRTIAINWPLWQDGGMQVSSEVKEQMYQKSGMVPLTSDNGLQAFLRILSSESKQVLVAQGDTQKLKGVFGKQNSHRSLERKQEKKQKVLSKEEMNHKLIAKLSEMISQILKIAVDAIDPEADFTEFGFDSISFTKYSSLIRETYDIEIMPSIFFDFLDLESLAEYLMEEYREQLEAYYNESEESEEETDSYEEETAWEEDREENRIEENQEVQQSIVQKKAVDDTDKIAVIGMSAVMPQSADLQEYWQHIVERDDMVGEIPIDRWDWKKYYGDPLTEEGKTNIKWGGFMDDIRSFDAPFFGIPAPEAEMMDPQQRLFMQAVWHAIEDAGYKASDIAGTKTSLFVGVASIDYNQLMQGEKTDVQAHSATGVSHSVLANRLSYFLDIHGQSEPVDTACSSSLIAVQEAMESLKHGGCEMAIAGGVNVMGCPDVYISFSKAGMLSPTGSCKTFDDAADGYARGEGCGAILLKPLKKAIEDKDHIYGVLLGSAVNHGGHAATLTAPNPNAQAQVITSAWENAGIDPFTVSYIEAHGTGTKLGDPVEIEGLKKAYAMAAMKQGIDMPENDNCSIGTVKTQIGHLETAAGIASVIKVLLCLEHKKLAGNIHFQKLNSFIRLKDAPFSILAETKDWIRKKDKMGNEVPRRAGISCFGFGGANAHLILEEYEKPARQAVKDDNCYVIPVSAKTKEALYCAVYQLQKFFETTEECMEDIVYTLWTGREEMKERAVVIAENKQEAAAVLKDIFEGNQDIGKVCWNKRGKTEYETGIEKRRVFANEWMSGGKSSQSEYVKNLKGFRCSVPGYPFEKKQYWLPKTTRQKSLFAHTMCFQQEWEKAGQTGKDKVNGIGVKRMLVFAGTEFKRNDLPAVQAPVIFVRDQQLFERKAPNEYGMNLLSESDYQVLFQKLKEEKQLPDTILLTWMLDGVEEEDREKLFYLLKSLSVVCKKETEVLLLYRNQESGETIRYPEKPRAFSAMLRSIIQENPHIGAKVIEISDSDIAEVLKEELARLDDNQIDICYKQEKRYARVLKHYPVPEAKNQKPDRRGVYVISGGMGGIGKILTEHLIRTRQADLVLLGRTPLTKAMERELHKYCQYGGAIQYQSCDITRPNEMEALIEKIKQQYGKIAGIFHCAGINQDQRIQDKTYEGFKTVSLPKVNGYYWMKELAKETEARFLMCFSSVVGIFGNQGQIDYAFANRYMDEAVLDEKNSNGTRLISVNWPLWEDGGMMPSNSIITANQKNGIYVLPVQEAMNLLEEILNDDGNEYIVLYGEDRSQAVMMGHYVQKRVIETPQDKGEKQEKKIENKEDETKIREKTVDFLRNLFAQMLRISRSEVQEDVTFQEYGVDSLIVSQFNVNMAAYFDNLSKTLLFEYKTVKQLAEYLVQNNKEQLITMFGMEKDDEPAVETGEEEYSEKTEQAVRTKTSRGEEGPFDIAIIGMSGKFPGSETLDEFWENLKNGIDLVGEVPQDRWDLETYYDPDPNKAVEGKMYCRNGGFVENADEFDPLFFNISKREAELMDPQERLFIEQAWKTFEDAGYTKERFQQEHEQMDSRKVGVFVGMTTHTYMLWGPEECQKGNIITPNMSTWSTANRISYLMNLNGPSMMVDTACSSSLTALHLACESILRGESDMALAGGVNLYLHPSKYVTLSIARMLSPTGKCHSFGKDSDGFVPGEGVGAFLLKPLWKAEEDNDHIYAVIKATAANHGGTANGFTVPNPNMQAALIKEAMEKGNITPETVSCIEAHGTGTALGDPIEITGLIKAFHMKDIEKPFCSVGSVKSNIGHLEAAAGVASIAKVILEMQHKKLVPSLHSRELNPNLILEKTPFYIQQDLEDWNVLSEQGEIPRRAGISAFGAGGANVHIILEEYRNVEEEADHNLPKENIFVLSAKNEDRLRAYVEELYQYLDEILKQNDKEAENDRMNQIAYTLQLGREELEERVAFKVTSLEEMRQKLKSILKKEEDVSIYHGNVKKKKAGLANLIKGEEGRHFIAELVAKKKAGELAQLWVEGIGIDWMALYHEKPMRTLSLPTYPFKKEKFFVKRTDSQDTMVHESQKTVSSREPYKMLTQNCSSFYQQHYVNEMDGREFYLRDHVLAGNKILPGVCYLEMARQAGSEACEKPVTSMRNVIWAKPVVVKDKTLPVHIVLKENKDKVGYEILTIQNCEKVLHAQGNVGFDSPGAETVKKLDVEQIISRCREEVSGRTCYENFLKIGFQYGSSFQGIKQLYKGDGEAISYIALPDVVSDSLDVMKLQPSIMDAALQTVTGVMDERNSAYTAYLPFSLGELRIHRKLERECYGYVKQKEENQNNSYLKKFEVMITDLSGEVLVSIKDFCVKALQDRQGKEKTKETKFSLKDSQVKYHSLKWQETKGVTEVAKTEENTLYITNPAVKSELFAGTDKMIFTPECRTYEEWTSFLVSAADENQITNVVWLDFAEEVSAEAKKLDNQIEKQFVSIFNLCKVLQEISTKNKKSISVLYLILLRNEQQGAMQSAFSGFGRTWASENRNITYKTVELVLQNGLETQAEQILQCVNAELANKEKDVELRYAGGKRFRKQLQQFTMEELPRRECSIRENGTYLITGGAGGLGILFAKHFAKVPGIRIALMGRSEKNSRIEAALKELEKAGAEVWYLRADVTQKEEVERAVLAVEETWGQINGVIHAAGIVRDSYIGKKTSENFKMVLEPKIKGIVWLDEVLKNVNLDFFAAFSSTAAIVGNPGQSDYALGNYFMNVFADMREQLHSIGLRSGETIICNWPLWRNGGMQVDEVTLQWLQKKSGTVPLEDEEGIGAFEQILAHEIIQPVISRYVNGSISALNEKNTSKVTECSGTDKKAETVSAVKVKQVKERSKEEIISQTEAELKALCAEVLKVSVEEIDREEELINYGLDSIAMMTMINEMEKIYQQPVDANLLAEYTTIEELAQEMEKEGIITQSEEEAEEIEEVQEEIQEIQYKEPLPELVFPDSFSTQSNAENTVWDKQMEEGPKRSDKIAVIGMACKFPKSEDIEQYWDNLKQGRDMITEVPESRWDVDKFYSKDKSEPNKSYSKWGGFIENIYDFSADYFKVSDVDAMIIDPHHRIMLELTDELFYRAGYEPKEMSGTRTSVFIGGGESNYVKDNMGKIPNEYMKHGLINNIPNMMAARISDFYNLKGSSKTEDSACSSSLVALHDACQAIRAGECDMALAGGVELLVDAQTHIAFSKAQVLAEDGRCKVFDESADGMVPGEGAGIVLLKEYEKAVEDGDNILGVILGSAVNNDGHTMGLTVPGMDGQRSVIEEAIERSKISPSTISYLEAHGTGTLLGDPIEIRAASQTYEKYTDKLQFCAVGSVKSNIGHLMRAAGMASFIKVILSLQNHWIPKTLHCTKPHPRFRFVQTPFYPATEGKEWVSNAVRRAAVSSFGFGGTNCHVIVEEYPEKLRQSVKRTPLPVVVHPKKHYEFTKWIRSMEENEEQDEEILTILDGIENGTLDITKAETLIQGWK